MDAITPNDGAYDIYGRQIAETNTNGVLVRTIGYDADGQMTSQWTAAEGLTLFGYDVNGNVTTSVHPLSGTISHGYDNYEGCCVFQSKWWQSAHCAEQSRAAPVEFFTASISCDRYVTHVAAFNRRMRKTARSVVWSGAGRHPWRPTRSIAEHCSAWRARLPFVAGESCAKIRPPPLRISLKA